MNRTYPKWTIYKELRFGEEGDFIPIEEEDIDVSDLNDESIIDHNNNRVTYVNNFHTLTEYMVKSLVFFK